MKFLKFHQSESQVWKNYDMEQTRTWSFLFGKGDGILRLFFLGGAIGGWPVMKPLFLGGKTGLNPPLISIVFLTTEIRS